MKITEETKIKDILPEGYDFVTGDLRVWDDKTTVAVRVDIKKKQKDFGQYASLYTKDSEPGSISEHLRMRDVECWPWGFKIDLFKYICEDIGVDFYDCLKGLSVLGNNIDSIKLKTKYICPKEFLKSLV